MDPAAQEPLKSGVIGQLLSEGYRFNFFQAVRLLELWDRDGSPVGHDAAPEREVVRFGAYPSLEFPASQITEVKPRSDEEHPTRMTVAFFGMTGPLGALPQHYTEILLERISAKDRVLQEFLDLFNHRLLSLFYRAWEKYHFWISGERALKLEIQEAVKGPDHLRKFIVDRRPFVDPMGEILLSLVGLRVPATRYHLSQREQFESRTDVSDHTWRYYAGLLSLRLRPAIGLQSILNDHFGFQVRVLPLRGRWLQLETDDRTRLNLGGNTRLGEQAVAGRKVWDVQGKFSLRIGPLNYEQFCGLLPIGIGHRPLVQITRFYAGQHIDFDLELELQTEEIPELLIGEMRGVGPRLGWNTWLKTRSFSNRIASVRLRSYDDVDEP